MSASQGRTIVTDERRLKQVLINLLSNAVKFTSQGAVVVRVKPKIVNSRRALLLSVKDSGLGIKPEDMPKLFKEFGTLAAHQALNPNGTGLGLYLSRRLVRLMEGDIKVKSTFGAGSKFTVSLPLIEPTVPCSGATSAASPSCQLPEVRISIPQSSNVLVVDDCESNKLVVSTLLRGMGVGCDCAGNGQEAIAAVSGLGAKTYSLIFMDINMPIMCGDAVLPPLSPPHRQRAF